MKLLEENVGEHLSDTGVVFNLWSFHSNCRALWHTSFLGISECPPFPSLNQEHENPNLSLCTTIMECVQLCEVIFWPTCQDFAAAIVLPPSTYLAAVVPP